MVMPVKSLHTLLSAGAGVAAPAGTATIATPVAEIAANESTTMNLRILGSLMDDAQRMTAPARHGLSSDYSISVHAEGIPESS